MKRLDVNVWISEAGEWKVAETFVASVKMEE